VKQFEIPTGLTRIQPIREIIFEYLREAIIDGRLGLGQKLVERELADIFQASRTPVREAMQKLEAEGFLEKKGKSYMVRGIDYREMEEAYLIRLQLEPLIFEECVGKLTSENRTYLQDLLDKFCEDSGQFSENLLSFDSYLFEVSGLPKIAAILQTTQEDLRRFRKVNLSGRKRRREALLEHRDIFDALLAGDKEKVGESVRRHVRNSWTELKLASHC
jgi:Transcriptional regulators